MTASGKTGVGAFTFSATIDSKGRITIPARIRNRLGLEEGDEVSLSLNASRVVVEQVNSYQEALELIEQLDNVQSFSYNEGIVEVVVDE